MNRVLDIITEYLVIRLNELERMRLRDGDRV